MFLQTIFVSLPREVMYGFEFLKKVSEDKEFILQIQHGTKLSILCTAFFPLIFARSRKDLVIGTISKIFIHATHGFITFFQDNNYED